MRVAVVALLVAFAGIGCSSGSGGSKANKPSSVSSVDGQGSTRLDAGKLADQLSGFPLATLTPTEHAGLLRMREEEKLALLGATSGSMVFSNISGAEQTHTDAVVALLSRYTITDPAAGQAAGRFADSTLQTLYAQLTTQGSSSLIAALRVGAVVEELDITDLQARATTTPDISLVYGGLEKGSRNHLRAFVKQLRQQNQVYVPTHLSQGAFDAIVSTATERGQAS